MIGIGALMVRDHPLTGVGPNMVPRVYAEYGRTTPSHRQSHTSTTCRWQIAAERGLPASWRRGSCLLRRALTLFRLFRRGHARPLSAAALASVVAMVGAGLFEYNFGDSEFLMLFLVLITLPFAAARTEHAAPNQR